MGTQTEADEDKDVAVGGKGRDVMEESNTEFVKGINASKSLLIESLNVTGHQLEIKPVEVQKASRYTQDNTLDYKMQELNEEICILEKMVENLKNEKFELTK